VAQARIHLSALTNNSADEEAVKAAAENALQLYNEEFLHLRRFQNTPRGKAAVYLHMLLNPPEGLRRDQVEAAEDQQILLGRQMAVEVLAQYESLLDASPQ
jgi:hypothetical protein